MERASRGCLDWTSPLVSAASGPGTDLAVVDFGVGGVVEVQRGLPAKPPAVQAHVLVCHDTVEVLMGRQWPN